MELTERYVHKDGFESPPNDSAPRRTMQPKPKTKTVEKPVYEDYDFQAARPPHKPTNILESTGHLMKGCLGGGILGIPEAYVKAGLWTSAVFTFIFGIYITYCVHILISAAQVLYIKLRIPAMSYPDLAEKSLSDGPFPKLKKYGKLFRYAVDITICIDLFGSCCVYEIIIAKTIQQLVEQTEKDGPINMLRLYILAIFIPILLLCMIRSLKYLAPFTLVADFFIVMCVVATIVYALQISPPISDRPAWKNVMGFFEFSGVVVFGMEGIGVCLPIENHMKQPKKFYIVLLLGMSVVVSFVFITGFFGYWAWGETVRTPVTLNFADDVLPTILKVLIGIMIYVTFALNFWAPFNLVWYYLAKKHPEARHHIWERIYRAVFVTIVTIIAVVFPNIVNLMGLIGSFCLSNMGFIYPAIIETLVKWDYPGMGFLKWRLWKNILILAIGCVFLTSGTYVNGKALLGV